uniref:Uncharacterized protein n=1 Tax=Anopheles farauti TaxID=69004 RepID=A0A182QCX6_9DIPT
MGEAKNANKLGQTSIIQSEIPRTYVKAPPNKTVRDVPVQYQSTGTISATHSGMTTPTPPGSGSSTITNTALVDGQQQLSYNGGARTIGRPVDGGRLAAAAPGPSLGGTTATAAGAGSQPKSLDKLQKMLRLFPATGGVGGGAGIHNHNQHYRSPPAAAAASAVCGLGLGSSPAASLSSPTSSSSSASSASSTGRQSGAETIGSGSSSVPVVSGSAGADAGHAPFTM